MAKTLLQTDQCPTCDALIVLGNFNVTTSTEKAGYSHAGIHYKIWKIS